MDHQPKVERKYIPYFIFANVHCRHRRLQSTIFQDSINRRDAGCVIARAKTLLSMNRDGKKQIIANFPGLKSLFKILAL
uniref:Uncharacterized protein n=1 Tax=Romanomermis culicivorax TaxID=13658 RepID=A0A915L6Q2_ROMCU